MLTFRVARRHCSKTYFYFSALSGFTLSAAWKPILLWLPSQKGLVDEAPQRHNAIFARPSVGTFVPAVS